MKYNRGFTLLLAVLISSILIALGGAIFDIVSKELVLSSSGRESQFAFFAADTGVECALYWDYQHAAFSSTSPLSTIQCGGVDAAVTRTPDGPGNPTFVATASFIIDGGPPCVDVKVTKVYSPSPQTTVEAFGHNTCDLNNPLRLERAIRVVY